MSCDEDYMTRAECMSLLDALREKFYAKTDNLENDIKSMKHQISEIANAQKDLTKSQQQTYTEVALLRADISRDLGDIKSKISERWLYAAIIVIVFLVGLVCDGSILGLLI